MNPLNLVYFPAAVALGALHALEPGHAKALTAAYLIGIKGTKKDSIVLGLSVAATHSIVVIGISGIGLWLGQEAFAGRATHWLEMASGFIAIAIGSWMLWRRLALQNQVPDHEHDHHAPDPVFIQGKLLHGNLDIVASPLGERMRFMASKEFPLDELNVKINRDNGIVENLILVKSHDDPCVYLSTAVPGEPHEFSAVFLYENGEALERIEFSMKEPHGNHDHAHMDDVAHAQAHAATLPDYAKNGERPSLGQIALFGAAGGMIPCPASITVMLLALSTGKGAMGVFTVLGFSLGLAIALVGVGLIVVSGLSKLSHTGRFSAITRKAPIVSACLVIVSGLFALLISN